jgi:hypothetical protein
MIDNVRSSVTNTIYMWAFTRLHDTLILTRLRWLVDFTFYNFFIFVCIQ